MNKIAEVKSVMKELGITPDLKGFHYTWKAVIMLREDFERQNIPRGITKILCEVAEYFGVSNTSVDRCIRYCIDVAIRIGNDTFDQLFGNVKNVTVSKFLSIIAEYI